jgi:hypothetical protein
MTSSLLSAESGQKSKSVKDKIAATAQRTVYVTEPMFTSKPSFALTPDQTFLSLPKYSSVSKCSFTLKWWCWVKPRLKQRINLKRINNDRTSMN